MTEPLIGACAKHGRLLVSCPECSPWRYAVIVSHTETEADAEVDKLLAKIYWEAENCDEFNRLRSLGQLRVACWRCHGCGKVDAYARYGYARIGLRFYRKKCKRCNGTGWEWNR